MEMVVTHLSKYGNDRACLAGIDLATGEYVRVKQRNGNFLTRHELILDDRPAGLGDILRFNARSLGHPTPHHEDHGLIGRLARVRFGADDVLHDVLVTHECGGVEDGLEGTSIDCGYSNACGFEHAAHSLCVVEAFDVAIYRNQRNAEKARIAWHDGNRAIDCALDDIRFYPDNRRLDNAAFRHVQRALRTADRVVLACSLGGWFEDNPGYWLLVAGLFIP